MYILYGMMEANNNNDIYIRIISIYICMSGRGALWRN